MPRTTHALFLLVWLARAVLCVVPLHAADQPCTPTTIPQPQATLVWQSPGPQPDGLTLTGLALARQEGMQAWQDVTTLPPDTETFTDTTLTPGQTYAWRLVSVTQDPAGTTVLSAPAPHATTRPGPCVTVAQAGPEAPLTLTVLPACGARCMLVQWEPSSVDMPVMLEHRQLPSQQWRTLMTVVGSSMAHSGLAATRTQCYRVKKSESSVWSKTQCGTTGG